MATVATLAVKLMADVKDMEKGFNSTVKTATKWGAGLAAAAGVAGAAVVGLMNKYGNFADELLDLNAITGLSTNEMQKWRKIATDAGVETNIMANSIKTLNGQLERGNELSPRLAKGFEQMGLTAEEFKAINPDEQLRQIVGTMMELEDADRRAFANQMNMADVLPIVAELEAQGKDLNEIMNEIDVPFGEEELKKMNEFRQSWDNFKRKIFEVLGEALMPLFEWFSDNMPMIEERTEQAFDIIARSIQRVTRIIRTIIHWFNEYKHIVLPIIKTVAAVWVAAWVLMAVQSTIQAVRMAAAWIIALGPIGWITAAVIGLAALVIGNWERIRNGTIRVWNSIIGAIRGPVNGMIGMANGVMQAFERMVNGIGSAVNRIPSFSIPSWVPGIGGNSFGLPNIPKISLPRIPSLDIGTNLVKNDGIAMLHKGEEVRPANVAGGGYSAGNQTIIIELDGREIARGTLPHMADQIRVRTGLRI